MKFKKGIKKAKINASRQKAKAKTKARKAKRNNKSIKKRSDKKRVERNEKRKAIILKNKEGKITNAKKTEIVNKANQVREQRRMELLGLAVMFKILNGRDIEKTDSFHPKDIKAMCEKFLKKYEKMDDAKKEEYKPLVPLAEKKIKQADLYLEQDKKIEKMKMEGKKNDK